MRLIALLVAATLTLPAADAVAWKADQLPTWSTPLQDGAKTVAGGAEIRWVPEPERFVAGESRRYIDHVGGDDANTGTSPDQAWKHHPWDADATGNAAATSGVHSYIFKGGVIYRGALVARESGTAQEPIRLTRDPAWGSGPATIAGSEAIGGWQRVPADALRHSGSPNLSLPEAAREHLWVAELPPGEELPTAVWTLSDTGERQRLTLARWPNWTITHPYNHFTEWFRVEKIANGFPTTTIYAPEVLDDPDPDAFDGATVWMDHANRSGEFSIIGPFPAPALAYDPEAGSLRITFTHPARHPQPNAPFFLENMPGFLDQPGEWYADPETRRLYLWLPDGGDPRLTTIEAARHRVIIDVQGQRHLEIAGLQLVGGNSIDLDRASRFRHPDPVWEHPDASTQMAAIRLQDACSDIVLRHLVIAHTAGTGIGFHNTVEDGGLRRIRIRDSQFLHIDNGGIRFHKSSAPTGMPSGALHDIAIVRNRLHDIGLRCSVSQGGRGIDVSGLTLGRIAGNVIERVAGQGVNVVGGRKGEHVPLVRIQIHDNQVEDTLMHKTDFGGIEFWGHGPAYVYNNISINPIGFVAHKGYYHKNECFYFDHGFKGYLFNNIGWSREWDEASKGVIGDHFFKEVRNRWNMAFHNTAYNLRKFQSHEGAHGDQQYYLANLAIDIRGGAFSFWRLAEAESIGYANNLVHGHPRSIYDRWRGDRFHTIEDTREHIAGLDNHVTDQVGWVTDDAPVVDAEAHDFRPSEDSAAIDRGVRVFVPWGLAATVGEWHFRHQPRDPDTALSDDLYTQEYHDGNASLMLGSELSSTALRGEGFAAADYQPGILEDWTRGALRFDGEKTMRIAHTRLASDIVVPVKDKDPIVTPGAARRTLDLDDGNLLIEAVFLAEAGDGELAAKLGTEAGYAFGLDAQGHLQLRLRAGGGEYALRSPTPVLDRRWHHALVEVDRAAGRATLYLDGAAVAGAASGTFPAAGESLTNESDFVVGRGLRGVIDYLRVARATLAEAETSIDELMAWQFNGPHLHDFLGQAPSGDGRDVGAVEHPGASGQRPIRYTPPAVDPIAEKAAAEAVPEAFLDGPERQVKAVEWGSVSVPKQAPAGSEIIVQVVFGTETIDRPQELRIDLHGYFGRKRVPGLARAAAIRVTPGTTTPYSARIRIPEREGLSRIAAVIYASPDGGWSSKTVSTEVGIELGGADGEAKP